MIIAFFCPSLISDWNNGNAHFLRGVAGELLRRGHRVRVYEPKDAWSVEHALQDRRFRAIEEFHQVYAHLTSRPYNPQSPALDVLLDEADLVLVHEWNTPDLIAMVGQHRRTAHYQLLFHDTHHRAISLPQQIEALALEHYDGVLAFGEVIRQQYLDKGWVSRAWTWHEAADVTLFYPRPSDRTEGELVWIGNWGDDERKEALQEFLFNPVKTLGLRTAVYGVQYSREALRMLRESGCSYRGWLPNYRVPEVFARYRCTVHVPRRIYTDVAHGIPTIRPFEALACGIPLISAHWSDSEHLFTPGEDFLLVENGAQMQEALYAVLHEPDLAEHLAEHGRQTILRRHTCSHRVDELLAIAEELGL